MKRLFLHIIVLFVATMAMADAVGTWKLYPSYTNITEVQYAKADSSECFVLAGGNLFAYYNSDHTFTEFMIEGASSATGTSFGILSSRDISHIAWCAAVKKLVIVYSDGMIDILNARDRNNPSVGSIVGLKETTLFTDKTVDSIRVGGQYAYLKTSGHVIKIDVKDEYIVKAYNTTDPNQVDGMTAATLMEPVALNYKYGSGTVPDGPASNYFWKLYKHAGKIYGTTGRFSYLNSKLSRYRGEVNIWNGITWSLLPMPSDFQTTTCMEFDSRDENHFFVGGAYGLIEYRNNQPTSQSPYNSSNSTLQPTYNGSEYKRCLICSMVYDSEYNLWVMNGWTNPTIHCYSNNGEWKQYPNSQLYFDFSKNDGTSLDPEGVFISKTNGYLWWANNFYLRSSVFRYDYKNEVLTRYSDFRNQDGTLINSEMISNLMEDRDGNIWVCGNSGPFYISASDVNSSAPVMQQEKVNRDDDTGLADYLLNGVYCLSIKEDVANRKWFATNGNGIFVINAANQEQAFHFTNDNSPLLSNTIYDVLPDAETGVVYFATDKGLCSYQSDVTSSYGDLSNDNVYAYPNPVTSEYTGDITIMGLSNGCNLKISNTAGQIVHSGSCKGGFYTWNGCDGTGKRVATGVYMVLVSNAEGDNGCVTKIAVIK